MNELPAWLRGERPRPALPSLVGAAGGLVLLAGMLGLFEALDEETVRAGGLALALVGLLVGVVLMLLETRGALRSAGVVLAAGAAGPFAFFILNEPQESVTKGDIVVTALVAVVGWVVLFLLSPARGHGLFLGLALFGLWFGAVWQTAPDSLLFPFWAASSVTSVERTPELPVVPPPSITLPEPRAVPTFTIPSIPEPEPVPIVPDPTTEPIPIPTFPEYEPAVATKPVEEQPPIAPAVVSVLFGVVYLFGAVALDRARLARLASAFVAVGTPVLASGVAFVGPRHGGVAVGVAAAALGLFLLAVGIGGERRFSAWAGAGVLAGGVVAALAEAFDEPGSGDAVAMLVIGAALVVAGWLATDPTPTSSGSGGEIAPHTTRSPHQNEEPGLS